MGICVSIIKLGTTNTNENKLNIIPIILLNVHFSITKIIYLIKKRVSISKWNIQIQVFSLSIIAMILICIPYNKQRQLGLTVIVTSIIFLLAVRLCSLPYITVCLQHSLFYNSIIPYINNIQQIIIHQNSLVSIIHEVSLLSVFNIIMITRVLNVRVKPKINVVTR